jgi:CNT family concentrative nucleoside transporter
MAANIFLESPLFIRPYLAMLSRGKLFMLMTGGMDGIAGTVFVLSPPSCTTSFPTSPAIFWLPPS